MTKGGALALVTRSGVCCLGDTIAFRQPGQSLSIRAEARDSPLESPQPAMYQPGIPAAGVTVSAAVVMTLIAPSVLGWGAPARSEMAEEPAAWTVADGAPLPFSSDEEVLDFLRHADVVALNDTPESVTESRVVTLALNGVTVRAAFHDHQIIKERQRLVDGSTVMYFRDSYLNQVAAFELARRLGMTNTPPTVLREVDGSTGSLQLWVENAMTERARRQKGLDFPDQIRAYRQVYDMDIFDALINNRDRSQGNFLWDQDWRLWMIDHTRSFGREMKVLKPASVRRCSRRLWSRLQELDATEVNELLEPFMGALERQAVMARQAQLVELIRAKIDDEGESEVLFGYDDPGAVTVIENSDI